MRRTGAFHLIEFYVLVRSLEGQCSQGNRALSDLSFQRRQALLAALYRIN